MTQPKDIRSQLAVPVEKLRRTCAPIEPVVNPDTNDNLGQETALDSLELGLQMSLSGYSQSHYNIVVVGPRNTGRRAQTLKFLRRHASKTGTPPPDIVCLPDPDSLRRPIVLCLPNGVGRILREALEIFSKFATEDLPKLVGMTTQILEQMTQSSVEKMWQKAKKRVKPLGYTIKRNAEEISLIPLSLAHPDQQMEKEEYDQLTPDQLKKLEETRESATAILKEVIAKNNQLAQDFETERAAIKDDLVSQRLPMMVERLRQLVGGNEAFNRYLTGIAKMADEFCHREQAQMNPMALMLGGGMMPQSDDGAALKRLCTVNLLVDNAENQHPPVIYAEAPQYSDLFGRINSQVAGHGQVIIDHTMIEPGDLLKADGGYLVIDLRDLLSWGGLLSFYKLLKVIRTRKLVIEAKAKFVDAEPMFDYQTQEIPVNLRVVVICDPGLDYLLRHHVPEFENLFRIVAEFDREMKAEDAPRAYATFVELCRAEENLPEFTPEAIAKLVEYGYRRAGGQKKASTEFGILKDVITEAAYWAKQEKADKIEPSHVQQAIKARYDRQALAIRRYLEKMFDDRRKLFTCEGEKVGQINALAVIGRSEDICFGTPARITARAYAGAGKVALVQRDIDTSGPSSNQAVAIISGYLAGQYGRKKALKLAVQLCFEQNYGGIDGDSASLAEMIAAISAITELPVDQSLAITGSMNQWGEAQPIGGANYKIEGHFEAIRRHGSLNKTIHGVVLPALNVDDLMLNDEVIEAVKQGTYRVYAVENIDQALEIFLGRPAAEIHALVQQKLDEMKAEKTDEPEKEKKPYGGCHCGDCPDKNPDDPA